MFIKHRVLCSGTTALHAMLGQHPDLRSSKHSRTTYEEVQFFSNDTLYLQGIEWWVSRRRDFLSTFSLGFRYLDRFDTDSSPGSSLMNFEKSATYFDSQSAMKRMKALLPNVRLIMILTEPGARAYSRYQVSNINRPVLMAVTEISIIDHGDVFDLARSGSNEWNDHVRSFTAHQSQRRFRVLSFTTTLFASWPLCWSYSAMARLFSSKTSKYAIGFCPRRKVIACLQISIIDGDALRRDPRPILDHIQSSFLRLKKPIESSKLVR